MTQWNLGAALAFGLMAATPTAAWAVDAAEGGYGYAVPVKPVPRHEAVRRQVLNQPGTAAAVVLAMPGSGTPGYAEAARAQAMAFAAAHRPPEGRPTVTARQLLAAPGSGTDGYSAVTGER